MNLKNNCHSAKVAIVGAGFVGSTTAYALMLNGVVSRLALIDVDKKKAAGEAMDLEHCMQFTPLAEIESGDSFELVSDADIVVVAAGSPQKPGEPRMDLLTKNIKIFKEMIPQIVRYNKNCMILVVTNPLDVLTYVTYKLSGFESCRVFGSGTVLDTARLRYLIGQELQVSPKDITAYVLGEHGDSEFVWWSKANIAGTSLDNFDKCTEKFKNEMEAKTKNAVYEIIEKKGATYYAIALVVAKIVRAILSDQTRIYTVSRYIDSVCGVSDVCLSLPTIVRKNGACETLKIELNSKEEKLLQSSAKKIKAGIELANSILGI